MTFLQGILLWGLPFVALPIIIHLIHQHRHRTIPWAAMMFLLDAKRMTRGMARLRQFMIMAMRMLAIAALCLAAARPLASGWIGLAVGGAPETTIILLDRSPSMSQQNLQTGQSKLSAARQKLGELHEKLGGSSRMVLIESTTATPIELDNGAALDDLPEASATDAPANLPTMMQAAVDYLTANQAGRTDIWVCSDVRRTDWAADSGRWASLRESFNEFEGVRFHLLTYSEPTEDNVSVEVRNVERRLVPGGAELVLDINLQRDKSDKSQIVPLQILINGARTVHEVEMTDVELSLQGHVVPIDAGVDSGWGRVELPGDSNPRDNVSSFVFAGEPTRRTVVVSDVPETAEPLRIAVSAPSNPELKHVVEVLTSDRAEEVDWNATSLLLWHTELPQGVIARRLQNFVESGRTVIFFPPEVSSGREMFGVKWGEWKQSASDDPFSIESWRGDDDLLQHGQSGDALPVGELKVYRRCGVEAGQATVISRFADGPPLLVRATIDAIDENASGAGAAWFCTTLPQGTHSSLARDGIVFYVMLQRALARGARALAPARQFTAGAENVPALEQAEPLTDREKKIVSTSRPYHSGVYRQGEQLIALNRPQSEDRTETLSEESVADLFAGLDYTIVVDRLDDESSLASEIWRAFLITMAAALILEAWLCLPPKLDADTGPSF